MDNKEVFSKEHVEEVIQSHELELSTLRSQIRKLEASVFEETDKAHRATRKAIELEEKLKSQPGATEPSSSLKPKGDSGRSHRRSATSSHVPSLSPLAEREAYDYATPSTPSSTTSSTTTPTARRGIRTVTASELPLPAAQRHRRRESLQMLAARISDNPLSPSSSAPPTSTSSTAVGGGLPGMKSIRLESKGHTPSNSVCHTPLGPDSDRSLKQAGRRQQFANDELLYCACCRDDLIIV